MHKEQIYLLFFTDLLYLAHCVINKMPMRQLVKQKKIHFVILLLASFCTSTTGQACPTGSECSSAEFDIYCSNCYFQGATQSFSGTVANFEACQDRCSNDQTCMAFVVSTGKGGLTCRTYSDYDGYTLSNSGGLTIYGKNTPTNCVLGCFASPGYYRVETVTVGDSVITPIYSCAGYTWSSTTIDGVRYGGKFSNGANVAGGYNSQNCWDHCESSGQRCLFFFLYASHCYFYTATQSQFDSFDFTEGSSYSTSYDWCKNNHGSMATYIPRVTVQIDTVVSYQACPSGFTSPSAATSINQCYPACATCDFNEYQSESDCAVCLQCPTNSISPSNSVGSGACICDTGFAGSPGACTSCDLANNEYAPMWPIANCMTCPSGSQSESVTRASFCNCKVGYFLTTDGESSGGYEMICSNCYLSDVTQIAQSYVANAQACQDECTNDDTCIAYLTQSGKAGLSCRIYSSYNGFTSSSNGLVIYGKTIPSYYCEQCGVGYYKADVGNQSCTQCPAEMISAAGSDELSDCDCVAGYEKDGATCTECTPGTFEDASTDTCEPCWKDPDNALVTGSPNNGRRGLVTSTSGSTDCDVCKSNAVVDTSYVDGVKCHCDAGYFEELTTDHFSNLYDYNNDNFEGSKCTPCPINTYKTQVGNLECVSDPTWADEYDADCAYYITDLEVYSSNYYGYEDSLIHCCWMTRLGGEAHDYDTYPMTLTRWEASQCTSCPANSSHNLQAQISATACKCDPGFTGPDGGDCTACPAGKYKISPGSAGCNDCPMHTTSPIASDELNDCICNAGYSGSPGASCTACVSGKYAANTGQSECTDCPASGMLSPSASISVDVCVCPHATYNDIASSTCTDCAACAANKYITDDISNPCVCIDCPSNAISPEGSSSVTNCECDVNFFGAITDTTSVCTACFDHSSSVVGSTQISACLCNAGYTGTSSCTECAHGTYKQGPGTQACTSCPSETTTTVSSGASDITECTCIAGYHMIDLDYECSPCDIGQFKSNTGTNDCTDCVAGSSTETDTSTHISDCVPDVGYIYNAASGLYEQCAPGTYKDFKGTGVCSQCDIGAVSPAGSVSETACVCSLNGYVETVDQVNTCVCANGYRQDTNPDFCTQCPAGTYCMDSVVNNCPAGSWTQAGSTVASQCRCNAGFSGPDGGPCSACGSGTYKPTEGSADCQNCPQNSQSSPGSNDLTDCMCNAGHTGPNGESCLQCVPGKYKEGSGNALCLDCPANSVSPPATNSISECLCNYGYSGPNGGTCTACEPDTFKKVLGDSSCSDCPDFSSSPPASPVDTFCFCNAGYTGPDGGDCTACVGGKYKDTVGSAECSNCPSNTISPQFATNINMCICIAGYTGPNGGTCEQCEMGKYKGNFGSAPCSDCPSDSISPLMATNINMCLCNSGHTGPHGGTCEQCQQGTYKDSLGSAQCSDCPSNSISPPTATDINMCICNAGYTGPNGGTCAECGAGTYKADLGSGTCLACDANAYSPVASTQAAECECNAGFSGNPGEQCVGCTEGTYDMVTLPPENASPCTGSINFARACGAAGNEACDNQALYNCDPAHRVTPTHRSCYPGGSVAGVNDGVVAEGQHYYDQDDYNNWVRIDLGQTRTIDEIHYYVLHWGWCYIAKGYIYLFDTKVLGTWAEEDAENQDQSSYYSQPNTMIYDLFGTAHAEVTDEMVNNWVDNGKTGPMIIPFARTGRFLYFVNVPGSKKTCIAELEVIGSCPVYNQHICKSCGANTYSPLQSDAQEDCTCNAGYQNDGFVDSQLVCTECDHGFYSSNQNCVACHANSHTIDTASVDDSHCLCNAGYTFDGSNCVACEAGKYKTDLSNNPCADCTANSFSDSASTQTSDCICNAGFAFNAPNCELCAIDTYKSVSGNTNCALCPEFSTSLFEGANHVLNCTCDAGYKGPGGELCGLVCAPGFYPDESNTNCIACEQGKFKSEAGDHACDDCYSNSFHFSQNATSIEACKCNHGYEPGAANECVQCPSGKFNNFFNEGFCHFCYTLAQYSFGKYGGYDQSSENEVRCEIHTSNPPTYCPEACKATPGYEGVLLDSDNYKFEKCEINTFNNGTLLTCEQCVNGSSHEMAAATSVLNCTCHEGYTLSDVTNYCEECEKGTYKQLSGPQTCTTCPEFSTTLQKASITPTSCVCEEGYYLLETTCTPCAHLKYKDFEGNAECLDCPDNSNTLVVGLTDNEDCVCNAGYTRNGQSCDACTAGKYKNIEGNQACVDCVDNSESSLGATFCTCLTNFEKIGTPTNFVCYPNCDVGFEFKISLLTCEECALNSYQDTQYADSSISCQPCPAPTTRTFQQQSTNVAQCFCPAYLVGFTNYAKVQQIEQDTPTLLAFDLQGKIVRVDIAKFDYDELKLMIEVNGVSFDILQCRYSHLCPAVINVPDVVGVVKIQWCLNDVCLHYSNNVQVFSVKTQTIHMTDSGSIQVSYVKDIQIDDYFFTSSPRSQSVCLDCPRGVVCK